MHKGLMIATVLALLALATACGVGEATPTPTTALPTPTTAAAETPPPGATATEEVPSSPAGNFRLLISDDRLAIGDFTELLVTIDRVGVQQGGESGNWIEFDAPVDGTNWTVDLTELQGDNAVELLRVELPYGKYTKVFVYIDKEIGVNGVLTSGDSVTLKLPSSKLQIVMPFEIVEGGPAVNFVFDIAVVAAGNEKSPKGIKYLLLPIIGKSGPHQSYRTLDTDAPTADAGADETVATGATVQLDGSGSSDPESDPLTYRWTLSTPDGSTATLSDATLVNPAFVADVDGKYTTTLVVNDGTQDSSPDSVEIEAEAEPNAAPEAEAGADQAVATGATVQLDGSGSSDPESDPLTYRWTLSTPDGSTATLSDATLVNPAFVADVDGTYIATLVVNDGTQDSTLDSVEITAAAS